MADGWLLKGLEDLVNKTKSLESEKREAIARIEALERENCELASIIAQASALVVKALKEDTTADPLTRA
jgi:FtsZ-binding cell division protein ZapB